MAALEVLVAENAAAHDGQIGVGADKIMGEQGHKVQQLAECRLVDDHGGMLGVEDDAVLVIVDVGAVLQVPVGPGDGHGDNPVVLPGGMVHPARVALVFRTEHTLGIARLGSQLGGGDGLGILLGLGEVDGDIQFAIFCSRFPAQIFFDAVTADVVRVPAQLVVPVRSFLGAFGIESSEFGPDLPGQGRQNAHELRVEQVPGGDIVLANAPGDGVVQQALQNVLQRKVVRLRRFIAVQLQHLQQLVGDVGFVAALDEAGVQTVLHQRREICVDVQRNLLLYKPLRPASLRSS